MLLLFFCRTVQTTTSRSSCYSTELDPETGTPFSSAVRWEWVPSARRDRQRTWQRLLGCGAASTVAPTAPRAALRPWWLLMASCILEPAPISVTANSPFCVETTHVDPQSRSSSRKEGTIATWWVSLVAAEGLGIRHFQVKAKYSIYESKVVSCIFFLALILPQTPSSVKGAYCAKFWTFSLFTFFFFERFVLKSGNFSSLLFASILESSYDWAALSLCVCKCDTM